MNEMTHVFEDIKNCYDVSYTDIAAKMGTTKQYISCLKHGGRKISKDFLRKLEGFYPDAFNSAEVSTGQYKIPYCPSYLVPHSFDLHSNVNEYIMLDKKLIQRGITLCQSHCRVVTLSDDSLSPVYSLGDKVILDTSQKRLIDGLSYLILYKGNYYIRKVKLLPDKVKCISTKSDEDTFIVGNISDLTVIALIVPNLRF